MNHSTLISSETLFAEAAIDAGLKLTRDAIWDGKSCNWIGANVSPVGGNYQVIRNSCSNNIYSGISGIALFLARLTEEVKEPLLEETFSGAMKVLLHEKSEDENQNYAYFSGKLGIGEMLIQLGEIKHKSDWIKKGWNMIREVCEKDPRDEEIDIMSGVAGAIPVLLRRFRESNESLLMNTAVKCGNFLIEKAVKTDLHWTWISMPGSPGLTGYSHGNAGIALALMELYAATRDKKWLDAAMMGFQYERMHFDAHLQNWPDLRQFGGPAKSYTCAEAWCHGAPGIALSRLRAWQITGDASFLSEARAALNTTLQGLHRSQTNYSLCHGIAGNADVLLTAGIIMQDKILAQAANEAGRWGLERFPKNNLAWPAGVSDPLGGNAVYENPSLMLGLAGTGYFYLRLAYPSKIPSILLVN